VSLSAKNTGGQYLVKINLDKTDSSVLSGMFVNVQFPVENEAKNFQSNMILISALIRQGQLTGIYTIGNGNVAILRWLRTGKLWQPNRSVVRIITDERYIASAEGKLFNGAKVSVQ
jgi:hypothetical protein